MNPNSYMDKKKRSVLGNVQIRFGTHRMKERDKELFIESIILITIYLISFAILSLGKVQQKFFGISETVFSNIQTFVLTFVFAVVITLIIYSLYKRATK